MYRGGYTSFGSTILTHQREILTIAVDLGALPSIKPQKLKEKLLSELRLCNYQIDGTRREDAIV